MDTVMNTVPELSAVSRTQGNNRALKAGEVTPRRARLRFEEVPVLVKAFRRMVRGLEFDVCEMAFSTYLCAREAGKQFTALPVFLVRGFHHGAIVVGPDAGISAPKDLEGRVVGVNRGYTVTTGVWARSILAREHGVDLDAVTWRPSGDEHVVEYRAPANVVPLDPGADLLNAVAAGQLAGAVGVGAGGRPGLAPLIPDAEEAGYRALRERGHYPINHVVVVRDDLLAADPDLAGDLFEAFRESKARYVGELSAGGIAEPTDPDRMYARVAEITKADPLPYGIEPNAAVIDELIDTLLDQRILTRRPTVESLFAPGTLDLKG
ncbi:MAG: ABC transporter substrate-binding protein [Actinocrinis sp.]